MVLTKKETTIITEKYFEQNNDESTACKDLWDSANTVIRGNVII